MIRTITRIGLILVYSLFLASLSFAQRLPELAVPENYKLTFTPSFTANDFTGEETIQVRVLRPTAEIVLNSADITFQGVSISSGGMTQKAKVTFDAEKEMATLTVEKPLQPGSATIQANFTGILNDELRGFYRGKDEQGRKYAVTQFEATDARRAFPSFDEPAYKATFDITIVADQGLVAISNSKVVSDKPEPAGKHTVRFATTPKMSAYLVAIAVGNFEYVEGSADGVPIRVYSTPGKKQFSRFALDASEDFLRYFNRYFGIKYPYDKLDLIGLPDFSAGAMENTGLITFREVILQLDENAASVGLKKEVAEVISHEMAHQWFGDLVTMQWWDDVWLNEGFATWMQSKPVEAWRPEWNVNLDDVQSTARTLAADSLQNTRPIHQAADTPEQIAELFDGIAYGKAASVLRMLEAYLGPENFRAGVNAYLKQHSYANATADDFWSTLAKASDKPVDKIMPTFVRQAGAPFISVKTQCAGNTTQVTLAQKRYFYDRALFTAGNDELWQVPVCLKSGNVGSNTEQKCVLLTQRQESFDLPGCASWVFANAGATGYYRSGYEPDSWSVLGKNAETALTPAERIVLLSDAWGSVRTSQVSIAAYLSLANDLHADRDRAVLEELLDHLNYIGEYLIVDSDRVVYEQWVRALLNPIARDIGWQAKAGDSDEQKSLRSRLMQALGHVGRDPEVIAEADRITGQVLENLSSVDRGLASVALQISAENGNEQLYSQMLKHLRAAKTPDEYYLYFWRLGNFSDGKLLDRTLQFALTSEVRSQDTLRLISYVMRNPHGKQLAWDFVRAHWPEIEKIGAGFTAGDIVAATGSFCDAGLRRQVNDFFSSHKAPVAERTLKQSLETMNQCVDLKSQQGSNLASWLDQQGSSQSGTTGH